MRRAILAAVLALLLTVSAGAETLNLPAGLKSIEAEAFMWDQSLDQVVIPEGCVEIGSLAFAYSGLTRAVLPASIESIADDAFDEGVVISAPKDSYAYQWAEAHASVIQDSVDQYLLSMLYNGWDKKEYAAHMQHQSQYYKLKKLVSFSLDNVDLGAYFRYSQASVRSSAANMYEYLCEESYYVDGITEKQWDSYKRYAAGGVKLVKSEIFSWMYNGVGNEPDDGMPVEAEEYYLFETRDSKGQVHNLLMQCGFVYDGGDGVGVKELTPWKLEVTEEKGKTIAHVTHLIDSDTPYTIEAVNRKQKGGGSQTENLGAYVNNQEMKYDFSTDIGLESGSVTFRAIDANGNIELIDTYVYDEEKKLDEDDVHGNERQFRRLVTHTEQDNPMDDAELAQNIKDRLTAAGVVRGCDDLISLLRDAPVLYRNMYLYCFYQYKLGIWADDTLFYRYYDIENILMLPSAAKAQSISERENAVNLIHESGHAIDCHIVPGKWFTKDVEYATVDSLMKLDLRNLLKDALDYAIRARELDSGAQAHIVTPDDYTPEEEEHIYNALFCPGRELDTGALTAHEHSLYEGVMLYLKSYLHFDLQGYLNADMTDALTGWSDNKIAIYWNIGGSIIETAGHTGAYYWYEANGDLSKQQHREGWAEYFASRTCRHYEKDNEAIFPLTIGFFDKMSPAFEAILKKRF